MRAAIKLEDTWRAMFSLKLQKAPRHCVSASFPVTADHNAVAWERRDAWNTSVRRSRMTSPETSSQGSPFWRFSLRFYRQQEVADACITLQDEVGVDVNLLLFLLWQATRKRALSVTEVEELERRIGGWRVATIIPLRQLRRALKTPPALVAGAKAELFRTKIKAIELEAERLQQEAMFDLATASPWGRELPAVQEAARANVVAYEAISRASFPTAAINSLLAALSDLERKPEE